VSQDSLFGMGESAIARAPNQRSRAHSLRTSPSALAVGRLVQMTDVRCRLSSTVWDPQVITAIPRVPHSREALMRDTGRRGRMLAVIGPSLSITVLGRVGQLGLPRS
jgi:hypothetical protein